MLHLPDVVPAVAPPAPSLPARPLLVLVRDTSDLEAPLAEAAGRARAAGRPLLVAVAVPPRPLTIDAAILAWHDRLVADLVAAMTGAVRHRCGPDVRVVLVRRPRGRGRRRLAHRLAALAHRHGAELHPPGPTPGLRDDTVPHPAAEGAR